MELKGFCSSDEINKTNDVCGSLIERCDEYMLSHPNSKLWLRDTDHYACPNSFLTCRSLQNDY